MIKTLTSKYRTTGSTRRGLILRVGLAWLEQVLIYAKYFDILDVKWSLLSKRDPFGGNIYLQSFNKYN